MNFLVAIHLQLFQNDDATCVTMGILNGLGENLSIQCFFGQTLKQDQKLVPYTTVFLAALLLINQKPTALK